MYYFQEDGSHKKHNSGLETIQDSTVVRDDKKDQKIIPSAFYMGSSRCREILPYFSRYSCNETDLGGKIYLFVWGVRFSKTERTLLGRNRESVAYCDKPQTLSRTLRLAMKLLTVDCIINLRDCSDVTNHMFNKTNWVFVDFTNHVVVCHIW